ncbi:MAG TPA: hypothetical protein VIL99_06090 [Ignavibacteria bacterium]
MKNLFLIVFLLLAFSCSKSQIKIPADNQDSETWATISYNFSSGPVSPQYQYSYSVVITTDKNCSFLYVYSGEFNYTKEFLIEEESFNELKNLLKESRILDIEMTSDPTHPLGGTMRFVSIVFKQSDPNIDQPPRVITAPYYPAEEYKTGLDKLYDFIESLIPEGAKKEAEAKRDEYLKNKK